MQSDYTYVVNSKKNILVDNQKIDENRTKIKEADVYSYCICVRSKLKEN